MIYRQQESGISASPGNETSARLTYLANCILNLPSMKCTKVLPSGQSILINSLPFPPLNKLSASPSSNSHPSLLAARLNMSSTFDALSLGMGIAWICPCWTLERFRYMSQNTGTASCCAKARVICCLMAAISASSGLASLSGKSKGFGTC